MQQIEIRFKGYIHQQWAEWFAGLTVSHPAPGETLIKGAVADQAALYGIISHLRDLGLQLSSVSCQEIEENSHEPNHG